MSDERLDKIEKEFADFRKDFQSVSENLKNLAGEKADQYEARARGTFRRARNTAEDVFSDVRDRGEEIYDRVRNQFSDATGEVESRVRENPLTSLAIVAGVGFLLGFLSRR